MPKALENRSEIGLAYSKLQFWCVILPLRRRIPHLAVAIKGLQPPSSTIKSPSPSSPKSISPSLNMAESNQPPTYIYKLIPSSAPVPLPPTPLPSALPVSELDKTSGFVHLSTAKQIPGTLKHFFADEPLVYVLRLPYEPLEKRSLIRWEDPKGEVCGDRAGEGVFAVSCFP
jgi:hypothetical protein